MTLSDLNDRAKQLRRGLDREVGQRDGFLERREELVAEIEQVKRSIEVSEEASRLLASYADARARALQERLEGVVNHGLDAVFGRGQLRLVLEPGTRGNTPTMDILVESNLDGESVTTDVMSARGGGVAAVVGALLRVVVMLWSQGVRPTLLLDETFAQLSRGYERVMADLLAELVESADLQIVLVTHSHAYDDIAGRTYHVSLVDGRTVVEEV